MINRLKKNKRINWKEGFGTTLLSGIMIVVCFIVVIVLFNYYELFNTSNRTQMITDIAADTSTAMAKLPYDVDDNLMVEIFNQMITENQNNLRDQGKMVSFGSLDYSKEEAKIRDGYFDQHVTFNVQCSYTSPFDTSKIFSARRRAKILVLAERPNSLTYGPNEMDRVILERALYEMAVEDGIETGTLNTDTIRYKSVQKAARMLHWSYSKDQRWDFYKTPTGGYFGFRDCSSFVYTSYQDFCTFFDGSSGSTTVNIMAQARRWNAVYPGLLNRWNRKDAANIDNILKPGDIIMVTGNAERGYNEYIGHTGIYLGDGYVMHANGGVDGIRITRPEYFTTPPGPDTRGCIYYIRIPKEMQRPGASLSQYIFNYRQRT